MLFNLLVHCHGRNFGILGTRNTETIQQHLEFEHRTLAKTLPQM